MSGDSHRRKGRDRPIFVLRLRPEKGVNPVHGLRHALKELLRRHGMRAVSVDQEKQVRP
jgi:hypothetical protein